MKFFQYLFGKKKKIETPIQESEKEASQNIPEDTYYSYYLFGKYEKKPIWHYQNWKKCAPLFQPIIALSPKAPYIKTEQAIPHFYGKDNQYVSYNKGGLRFGRMLWNDTNNKKWTTKYAKEKNWRFFSTEVAYPTRNTCEKNCLNPELFITISNENLMMNEETYINQAITIHINTKLITESKLLELEKDIQKIGKHLQLKIAGKMTRKETFQSSQVSFARTNSLWNGAYGVLNSEGTNFSKAFLGYGIKEMM